MPSALGFGGGGSVDLLEADVDTDDEAVKLVSGAKDVLLGVIGEAVSELLELFINKNYSFILKTSALPRVAFEINRNCNCRNCDHCKDHKSKHDCFRTFIPREWKCYFHISLYTTNYSLQSTCGGNISFVFVNRGSHPVEVDRLLLKMYVNSP